MWGWGPPEGWKGSGILACVQDIRTQGLTAADVAERVARGQVNTLPPRSGRTVGQIVRDNVFTRINAILAVLLVVVLTTGSWINAAFGLLIIANSAIGIIQELRAKHTLDSLAVVGEAQPLVHRADGVLRLPRDHVVLDDLIELAPGDQLVVDGEVVSADHLEVDESLLTGEADPEPKQVGDSVMSGSFAVAGAGLYRATKVGADAYAAQLAAEASKFTLVHSELQGGINKILRFITWLLIPVGLATIVVQLTLPGVAWNQAILGMAGALVPMVPEGLVLITSMAFALGVIRLGRQKVLVQELAAIEGLARVDVVCADKTGTLTEQGMRCQRILPIADLAEPEVRDVLANLTAADPHPNASLVAIAEAVGTPERPWTPTQRAPFTSAKKWSGARFGDREGWVLGAPDVLADGPVAAQAEELASGGLRVLLIGRSDDIATESAPGHVDPVALVVLEQRVRPDARATLEYFHDQDVTVKVISGDNARSVGAVTSALGVSTGEPVDARTLDTPARLSEAVAEHNVFGRVTPDQKRAMVGALQQQGHTVAMTGDGVNDVLALKDADLGVAMGSGAPATRAVAKIVLLDDRFATLPAVVGEGRRVLGNIERVANLFLTKTIYSAILALLVVLWRLPFPFLPIHVTITGWFTIGIPAFLLSLAPNNERARPGFVQRVMRLGLPAGSIVAVTTFVTYLILRNGNQLGDAVSLQVSTATLACLIVGATWVLSVVARPYRWSRVALVAAAYGAYAAIFVLPVTAHLFRLDISNGPMMQTGVLMGLLSAGLVEAAWWIRARIFGVPAILWAPRGEDAEEAVVTRRHAER
jgi:cation-transporting ATPase E